MAKYLVVKGWLGFGDRLESLKMAVKFAIEHKLTIYVDWTDSIWSHGSETFYSYFDLINMSTIKSLDDIPADATVYPSYWKDHIKEPITQELLDDNDRNKDLNIGVLKEEHLKKADVIVYSSIGYRALYDDSSFFANVFRVKHPKIIQKVEERNRNHALGGSLGIHVRGTDRKRNENQFAMKIQWMSITAVHNGGLQGQSMIAVSDDHKGLEIWKRFFPQTVILSDLSVKNTNNKGNHNAKAEELSTTKDHMNIDMLIDFFTLASCKGILTTYKDSRFAQEARRLSPHVKRILGN